MSDSSARTPQSWDQRYQTGDLPWDSGSVDANLLELLRQGGESELSGGSAGHWRPRAQGQALEIGCGTGTNAIALARAGFARVIATDLSPTAIDLARRKALSVADESVSAAIDFRVHDVLASPPAPAGSVAFAFDRGVFHVVAQASRSLFAQRVAQALEPGGFWLSLAGNADDATPGGPPRLTAGQIAAAVEPVFEVIALERSRFNDIRSQHSDRYLCWKTLLRKRG
jgi:SAM-dependent methyltransferase